MFARKKLEYLKAWKVKKGRKPLILRGARQVGKTTLIDMFSKEFDIYLSLNLERPEDHQIFAGDKSINTILQMLFLRHGRIPEKNESVLLFIDEIQNSTEAINLLRYFFEDSPQIHVIATGSLLETLLDKKVTFPVGRIEYMFLYPFSFEEYVLATGNKAAYNAFQTIPFPNYGYDILNQLFKEYLLIGGMPEIVKEYLEHKHVAKLNPVFDSLILAYLDDVEKYAKNEKQANILRHIIQNAFIKAGERIKFEGFAASNYKSTDVAESFRLLEKTFLLQLVYPTTQITLPIQVNKKKSPRLQVLDTGIVNRMANIQAEILGNNSIDSVYGGKVVEHIVGQELLANQHDLLFTHSFWVKEKKQSNAEVDYLIQSNGQLIPVEVKSGSTGRLRSLMEYIDLAPHNYAVRIYSGPLEINEVHTIKGKPFRLLNLPAFLSGKIQEYVDWFVEGSLQEYVTKIN